MTHDGEQPVDRMLTLEQLRELAAGMSMGDIWRAQKEAGDDKAQLGMLAFYYAAKRTEQIAQDETFEGFLDRVRQSDFRLVNEQDRSKSDRAAIESGAGDAGAEDQRQGS